MLLVQSYWVFPFDFVCLGCLNFTFFLGQFSECLLCLLFEYRLLLIGMYQTLWICHLERVINVMIIICIFTTTVVVIIVVVIIFITVTIIIVVIIIVFCSFCCYYSFKVSFLPSGPVYRATHLTRLLTIPGTS